MRVRFTSCGVDISVVNDRSIDDCLCWGWKKNPVFPPRIRFERLVAYSAYVIIFFRHAYNSKTFHFWSRVRCKKLQRIHISCRYFLLG
ncbi:hypothetical protein FRACYDRAFT_268372 [Fragilariopsis cylindrus CCMP1102]|uniref:Uncharacterized protein n=1 Tax=Fragilariopsis cylindrus CCMP1102 TaxID=635003 RepID=A0A1E7FKC2_9STRA|nr:hypothetical protein FRACYDRAFT_268372 [Fragilariopsis cylindrus CCMP1102]|eukprot:OEU18606.1 hypothetical protein FRACYDRAFT_268372 [Fragilariopsis cylindrus CCMP1102]